MANFVEIFWGQNVQRILFYYIFSEFGWRAAVSPADHPVSKFEFDFIIGANGRKSTLPGFNRTNLRAQLAIAVTANFVNKRTLVDNAVSLS